MVKSIKRVNRYIFSLIRSTKFISVRGGVDLVHMIYANTGGVDTSLSNWIIPRPSLIGYVPRGAAIAVYRYISIEEVE